MQILLIIINIFIISGLGYALYYIYSELQPKLDDLLSLKCKQKKLSDNVSSIEQKINNIEIGITHFQEYILQQFKAIDEKLASTNTKKRKKNKDENNGTAKDC